MSKLSVDERIARGEWAKSLTENAMYKGVKAGIMMETLAEMMMTDDKAKVSALHDTMRGMERFEQALLALKNDATKARSEGT